MSAAEKRPGWVTVRIADNGIGIPEGQHDSIFDEFHRAHGGYQGTGLGLSIVQRIVTRHGGMISATSIRTVTAPSSVQPPDRLTGTRLNAGDGGTSSGGRAGR